MFINIKDIQFYYLNADSLDPKYVKRREHMESLLTQLGLKYSRITGTKPNHLSPSINGGMGLLKALETALKEPFEPFIILEDDVALFPHAQDDSWSFEVPDNTDCVYLGLSKWGIHPVRNTNWLDLWKWKINNNLFRIGNMLSTHAKLYLTPQYVRSVQRTLIQSAIEEQSYDIYVARIQEYHQVYALGRPLFYQSLLYGGQEEPTHIIFEDSHHDLTPERYQKWANGTEEYNQHFIMEHLIIKSLR